MHLYIYEASVPGVFRLILIVIVVYLVFSLFTRFIIPSMMKKYITNFQKKFTEENQRAHEDQLRKKEGEISIKYVNKDKNEPRNSPGDGDYVDYEEIK